MTREQEARRTPQSQKRASNQADSFMSPNFRSMAAMAGWDEEALLVATLVVEDTPDRDLKCKRRSVLSTSNSKRKRRNQNQIGAAPNPHPVINLVGEQIGVPKEGSDKESKVSTEEGTKEKGIGDGLDDKAAGFSGFPCMDRLREELSCAICLEICFEPSTTPCGHSFCKKCLRSAADKCGKRCPKCRQLISNGRSCIVNTVLWNTIQLLFPEEVKGRKALGASTEQESKSQRPEIGCPFGLVSSRSSRVAALSTSRRDVGTRRQRGVPSQDEDAALAQRLQREEFRQAFGATSSEEGRRRSISLSTINESAMARAMRRLRPTIDVRAMAASRAMSRRRPT